MTVFAFSREIELVSAFQELIMIFLTLPTIQMMFSIVPELKAYCLELLKTPKFSWKIRIDERIDLKDRKK